MLYRSSVLCGGYNGLRPAEHEEVENLGVIRVSSTRGDYALVNLAQVSWATVEASRVTLHMADGATFMLKGDEARSALEGLRPEAGNAPRGPDMPR